MYKSIVLALAATAATLGAGAAQAGNVSWSIGIHTPVVGTVFSNGPTYGHGRGYAHGPLYAPASVYVEAPPLYRSLPAPVYYRSHGVYYRPVPVVYPRSYPGWRHGQRHDHRRGEGRGWRHD